jgi:divalent metal cation (Fe/Co/Zn/Cd) transporter
MNREALQRQARRLAWVTLVYNLLEALASVWFGGRGGSLSLLGFGCDSMIEAASGAVVLWSLAGADPRREGAAQRWIGTLLLALALFLGLGAWMQFRSGKGPDSALPGLCIALVSLAVMAWLYRAKAALAAALDSAALKADAFCTLSCMWLSGLLLLGSAILGGTHILWFDSLTTAAMAVLIAREGAEEYDEGVEAME